MGTIALSQVPRSMVSLPYVVEAASNSISELDLGVSTRWISSVQLRLKGVAGYACTGVVHVIPEQTCNTLPTKVETSSNFYHLTYLLAGSHIAITIKPGFSVGEVWLLSSVSAWKNINSIIGDRR